MDNLIIFAVDLEVGLTLGLTQGNPVRDRSCTCSCNPHQVDWIVNATVPPGMGRFPVRGEPEYLLSPK